MNQAGAASVLVEASLRIGMAGDAIRLGAHILVLPFPGGDLAVFTDPFRQLGNALGGAVRCDAA